MHVSVIIPVYNAGKYLSKALESVIAERKQGVSEIIVVEDGSSDNSYEIALEFQQQYPDLVHLYRHPDGENKGAGAARNLGIRKASADLVCFLDADDYWLPGRLDSAIKTFENNPSIDGVYEPAVYRFESEAEKEQFSILPSILGTNERIPPRKLFVRAMTGTILFCTNGIVLKRDCFKQIGYFNETLLRGQDMDLILKMTAKLTLISSEANQPIAVVRRHGNNRWNPGDMNTEAYIKGDIKVYRSLLTWAKENNVERDKQLMIARRLIFLFGCTGQIKRAWQTALEAGNFLLVLNAWQYKVPGPRTLLAMAQTVRDRFNLPRSG